MFYASLTVESVYEKRIRPINPVSCPNRGFCKVADDVEVVAQSNDEEEEEGETTVIVTVRISSQFNNYLYLGGVFCSVLGDPSIDSTPIPSHEGL